MKCERCDGNRMIYVAESTVDALTPRLDEDDDEFRLRVARVRNSAFPCPLCNRPLFAAWQAGHVHPDHDRHDCSTCFDLFGPPPRLDNPPA